MTGLADDPDERAVTRIARGTDSVLLVFWCPACDDAHAPRVEGSPAGPLWAWNQDRVKPTLNPSVRTRGGGIIPEGQSCHSQVTDGMIYFYPDSWKMAGETVPLPAWTWG